MKCISIGWAFIVWDFRDAPERRCYFRVFGYGLYFSWQERPTFSERMGLRKLWRCGHLVIEALRPGKAPGV